MIGFRFSFTVENIEVTLRLQFHGRHGLFLTWNLHDDRAEDMAAQQAAETVPDPQFLRGDPARRKAA